MRDTGYTSAHGSEDADDATAYWDDTAGRAHAHALHAAGWPSRARVETLSKQSLSKAQRAQGDTGDAHHGTEQSLFAKYGHRIHLGMRVGARVRRGGTRGTCG